MSEPHVVLPSEYAGRIIASGGAWGTLGFRRDSAEDLWVVSACSKGEQANWSNVSSWQGRHYLNSASVTAGSGLWYRVKPELHELWRPLAGRGAAIPVDYFKEMVTGGWRFPPANGAALFTLALSRESGSRDVRWSGWWISSEGARPASLDLVDEDADLLAPLEGVWPLEALCDQLVVVIGVGSVGSAALEALASYGVRTLALIDPDRLLSHNSARHRVDPGQVGRLKVNAVADRLTARDPLVRTACLPWDVIDDADRIRPLLATASAVLACCDGVEPRRIVNHLAWRAGVPAIFSCVLDDGAVGEIVRVWPGRTGCLLCTRTELRESGGMDPEPRLDRGYGTGTRHLPMTAVGGDLGVVGEISAKVVVSTLLEQSGYREHRLTNDHAIIGLRGAPDLAEPFDIDRPGEFRWRAAGRPHADCPTCAPSA